MKYLNKNLKAQNITAEALLASWEDISDLKVCCEGVFTRNYSEDLLRIDTDQNSITIFLSRDGIYHLLPQGLFFTENQLKEEQKRGNNFKSAYDKLKKQKQDAQLFFQPLDTELFKLTIAGERNLNNLLKTGNKIWLSNLPDDSKNEYINKLIPLLPYAAQLRGNMQLLTDLLKSVFDVEKIEIKEIAPLYARFIIHKEGLSKEEYLAMNEDLKLFFDFFSHWFLPLEKKYDFKIKDFKTPFTLGTSLVLDYNTNL